MSFVGQLLIGVRSICLGHPMAVGVPDGAGGWFFCVNEEDAEEPRMKAAMAAAADLYLPSQAAPPPVVSEARLRAARRDAYVHWQRWVHEECELCASYEEYVRRAQEAMDALGVDEGERPGLLLQMQAELEEQRAVVRPSP